MSIDLGELFLEAPDPQVGRHARGHLGGLEGLGHIVHATGGERVTRTEQARTFAPDQRDDALTWVEGKRTI